MNSIQYSHHYQHDNQIGINRIITITTVCYIHVTGAKPEEVAIMNGLSVSQHLLLVRLPRKYCPPPADWGVFISSAHR